MPSNERKKRRTIADQLHFSCADCVTFDTCKDSTYPVALITENLLRSLNYEGLKGIAEILSWIIRSAGCNAQFNLSENMSAAEIVTLVDQLEASCLESPSGCPATFPMQRADYSKRVKSLLVEVVHSLENEGSGEVLIQMAHTVAALTAIRIQSLRLVATTFAGIIANAYKREASGRNSIVQALVVRTGDIAVAIRKLAVSYLGNFKVDVVVRSLNDLHASVRLSALKTLTVSKSIAGSDSHVHGLDRVEEIAIRDTDLACRRAALRLLATHDIYTERIKCMLDDDDEFSRKLAADLFINKLACHSHLPQHLVLKVAQLGITPKILTVSTLALEKIRSKYNNVEWPQEIITMLLSDPAKELRRTRLADKQEFKRVTEQMQLESTQIRVLKLLETCLERKLTGTGNIIAKIAGLVRKMQFSDTLLSLAIRASAHIPYDTLLASTVSQKYLQIYVDLCKNLFMDRSERNVMEALSLLIEAFPTSIQKPLCGDLYHDLRIKFAALLGPRGQIPKGKGAELDVLVLQFIILSRFIDISDLCRLPIWNCINQGNENVLQLARVMGMKGDIDLIRMIVGKLASNPEGKVDDLLRIFISAKLRSIDLEIPFPIDVNEVQPSSESVWQAAIASNAI